MLALLLVLQIAAAPRSDTLRTDSLVRVRVDSAIRRFQLEWRDAWGETRGQDVRIAAYDNPLEARLRLLALHCHGIETNPRLVKHIVTGLVRSHATCPIWMPVNAPKVNDERRGIDGALTFTRRWRVRELRRRLRLLLDTAAMQLPGDERIAAQRVRFAIDDGDQMGAVKAAAACARVEGDCGMLRGLVLFRAARVAQADSAFLDAVAMMPETERCAWNDVSVLLELDQRQRYTSTPCAERAEVDARFWWLTDPLWLEPGNERRAEQFARKTLVTLLAPPWRGRAAALAAGERWRSSGRDLVALRLADADVVERVPNRSGARRLALANGHRGYRAAICGARVFARPAAHRACGGGIAGAAAGQGHGLDAEWLARGRKLVAAGALRP